MVITRAPLASGYEPPMYDPAMLGQAPYGPGGFEAGPYIPYDRTSPPNGHGPVDGAPPDWSRKLLRRGLAGATAEDGDSGGTTRPRGGPDHDVAPRPPWPYSYRPAFSPDMHPRAIGQRHGSLSGFGQSRTWP